MSKHRSTFTNVHKEHVYKSICDFIVWKSEIVGGNFMSMYMIQKKKQYAQNRIP